MITQFDEISNKVKELVKDSGFKGIEKIVEDKIMKIMFNSEANAQVIEKVVKMLTPVYNNLSKNRQNDQMGVNLNLPPLTMLD